MDAVTDPLIEKVTIMGSAQWGKTEIMINILGYYIDHEPSPIFMGRPSKEAAAEFSRERLMPTIRKTPQLNDKFRMGAKDGSNTILNKAFEGGFVALGGGNSVITLSGRPVRIVLLDELDRWPFAVGNEGDPVDLAMKRATTFWNRKYIFASTPTVKGVSRIEASYMQSDRRRYYVPCPMCGTMQELLWEHLRIKQRPIVYQCPHCRKMISEDAKPEMISGGAWMKLAPAVMRHAGFFIWEIYSPWVSWEEMAENFLKTKDDPEKLKDFVNLSLGETWEERGTKAISDQVLMGRVENSRTIPEWVLYLTSGVDVQDNRLEFVIKGWGMHEESILLDHLILQGSPGEAGVWKALDAIREMQFDHPNGVKLQIAATCIDSGGHFTDDVYNYVINHISDRVYAIKGDDGLGRPVVGKGKITGKKRMLLYPVGSWTATEKILGRLEKDEIGPGYMHFNRWSLTQKEKVEIADEEYFLQLTGYRLITVYDKGAAHIIRKKLRARREAHDCEVYALAAKMLLNPDDEAIAAMMKEEAEKEKKDDGTGGQGDQGTQEIASQRQRRSAGWWIKPR